MTHPTLPNQYTSPTHPTVTILNIYSEVPNYLVQCRAWGTPTHCFETIRRSATNRPVHPDVVNFCGVDGMNILILGAWHTADWEKYLDRTPQNAVEMSTPPPLTILRSYPTDHGQVEGFVPPQDGDVYVPLDYQNLTVINLNPNIKCSLFTGLTYAEPPQQCFEAIKEWTKEPDRVEFCGVDGVRIVVMGVWGDEGWVGKMDLGRGPR